MMEDLYLVRVPLRMEALVRWSRERGWVRLGGREVDFDEGEALHHLVDETLGPGVLRPFRLMNAARSPEGFLYAYSMASADALRESIGLYAGPEHLEVIGPERIRTRAVPGEWRRGQRLGFDLRVRPVRRAYSRIETPGGRVYKKGAEMDAWLSDRLRSEHWKHESPKPAGSREEAYLDWLSERFSRVADLDRVATRLVRYRRAHARRRAVTTGPDATFQGTLTIKGPGGFTDFLRRGVGRHCGYGYGMLLLRPPDSGESWNARE